VSGIGASRSVDVTNCMLESSIRVDCRASTDGPTVINLTNHLSLNLAGDGSGSVEAHTLVTDAGEFTPVSCELISTRRSPGVADTPLDLRHETATGAHLLDTHRQLPAARGYDHNDVLRAARPTSSRWAHRPTYQPRWTCRPTGPGCS
jgi:aldose 1-epimerase